VGELITTWHCPGPDGWPNGFITVDRADPLIDIADEVLCEMTRKNTIMPTVVVGMKLLGDRGPGARKDGSGEWFPLVGNHGEHLCHPALRYREPPFCFTDSMLRVEPVGRDPILYRIREFDFEKNTWEAAWPD
jgi:hypothetical protein